MTTRWHSIVGFGSQEAVAAATPYDTALASRTLAQAAAAAMTMMMILPPPLVPLLLLAAQELRA